LAFWLRFQEAVKLGHYYFAEAINFKS
jgi:hypothetical protein